MKSIKIGLAPTRRFCFSVEDALRYKSLVEEKLKEWNVSFVNIDSVNPEGLLLTLDDARKTVDYFNAQNVGAVFAPHVNFGTEEAVAYVAKKMGKPFLLWGPRDEAPLESGEHLRDTQCGLFATSNLLKKYRVPFTYVINSRVDSAVFKRGFLNFTAAARVANGFIGARIGQISTRPPNFYTVIVNEQELLSRWGIELVPITLIKIRDEITRRIKSDKRVADEAESIRQKINLRDIPDDALLKTAALKLFMLEWARREGLSAIAIRCHEDFPDDMGFYSCFANGEVTAEGVPVACETDIHGAISSVMLQNASLTGKPVFLADMTNRHPTNNNAELLWHCGNFPYTGCKDCSAAFLGRHCNIRPPLPGTGNFEYKADKLTVARFDGIDGDYRLLMGQGKPAEGPYNLGTYTWMEVENWPEWEEKLIYGPYIHHVAGIDDHCSAALYEAVKYIPGLTADPVHPTDAELRAWLRGEDIADE